MDLNFLENNIFHLIKNMSVVIKKEFPYGGFSFEAVFPDPGNDKLVRNKRARDRKILYKLETNRQAFKDKVGKERKKKTKK